MKPARSRLFRLLSVLLWLVSVVPTPTALASTFIVSDAAGLIAALQTANGNNALVYLTDLHSRGAGRGAEIHGGAFIGPKIGGFAGTQRAPGRIRATFSTGGLGTVKAVFVRFSTKPTP